MRIRLVIILLFFNYNSFSQGNPPWQNPLRMAWSNDGIIFSNNSLFQDSSGVPCLIKWKGDTLACVFQWFRQPMNSPTWDKVAIKFSYDAGLSWTIPVPIVVNGLPVNYQRPFDPALTVLSSDSLRIYFSSSDGMPVGGLDSLVNTYSASSVDGINYTFEPGPRFNHPTKPVIDPSVIFFNGNWHYAAPAGAPQDGAFHCLSSDGINFIQQADYLSDNMHNWTGNFMLNNPGELRFYGSGQYIWYNNSFDDFSWNGFTNTNLIGGDPSVVKLDSTNFLIVYVGQPYNTGITENYFLEYQLEVYPNPFLSYIQLLNCTGNEFYYLIDSLGQIIWYGNQIEKQNFSSLTAGLYILRIKNENSMRIFKIVKE